MASDAVQAPAAAIDGPAALPSLAPSLARELMGRSTVDTITFARPPVDQTPYGPFVRALLTAPPFKVDVSRMPPAAAFAALSDQLFGPGKFVAQREVLAREVATVAAFMRDLCGGTPVSIMVRTYFNPGDLVWHVDRSQQTDSLRLLWPMGRPGGMRVTPAGNIDQTLYAPFMRRELPLLCELDRKVFRTGEGLEGLWAHRPRQMQAMTSGVYPFLRDPAQVWQIQRDAISVHRFHTPRDVGTYHRSAWENRNAPGLQIVMTTGGA